MEDFYSPDELRFVPEGRKGDVRPLLSDVGKTDSKELQSMESSDYFPPAPSVKTDSSNNQRNAPTPETSDSKVTLDPKDSAKPVIADKQSSTPVTAGSHEQFVNVSRVADAHLKNSKVDTVDAGVESPRPTSVVTPSNSGLRSASELTQAASDLVTGKIKQTIVPNGLEGERQPLPSRSSLEQPVTPSKTQSPTEPKPSEAPSTLSKSAPQGDVAAATPLVSGSAASASVTAINRDSAPIDRAKTPGVADVAKPNLPAPEAKGPVVAEQPKSANLAGDVARAADASSSSRASAEVPGGYKSDFGNRNPVETRTAAGRPSHDSEGKGGIDKVAEARSPLAGARNPVAGLLPNSELKGISNKLSTIDSFVGKSDKDARGARRSEGADAKTGNKLDGKSDSKLEGKQDGKFGAKPGDRAGERGASGLPLSGRNALLNNLTDKINERINKSGEKPGVPLADKRSGDKPWMPTSDKRPGDKPGSPSTDKNTKIGDKASLPTSDKNSDKTQVRNWDNAQVRSGDKSTAQPGDKSAKSTDRTNAPLGDKGKPFDKPNSQGSDKIAPGGADRSVDASRAPRAEQTISSRMMGIPILNNIAEHIIRLRPEPRTEVADSRQAQKLAANGPRINFVLKDIEVKPSSAGKRPDSVGSRGDAQSSKTGARPEADTSSDARLGAKQEKKPDSKSDNKLDNKPDSRTGATLKPDASTRSPAAGSERVVRAEWGKVPDLSPHFDTGRLIPLLLPTGLKGIKVASQVENTTIIKDDGAPTARVARPEIRLHLPDGTYGGQKVVPGHRVPRFEESKAQEAATVPLKVWSDKPQSETVKGLTAQGDSIKVVSDGDGHGDGAVAGEQDGVPLVAEPVDTTSTRRKRYVNPAIDALDETLSEEEEKHASSSAHASDSSSDSSSEPSSDSSSTSAASSTADLLLGASRQSKYLYTVKPGDTAESVAISQLQDQNLAPLIVRKNNRYVLPAPAVGVTPLREGAQITLPNPAEIAAYRKAAQ